MAYIETVTDETGATVDRIYDDPDNLMKVVNAALVNKTQAEVAADALQELADATNPAIKAQLIELDIKRIRPLATVDTAYLAHVQTQVDALVAQLIRDSNGVVL